MLTVLCHSLTTSAPITVVWIITLLSLCPITIIVMNVTCIVYEKEEPPYYDQNCATLIYLKDTSQDELNLFMCLQLSQSNQVKTLVNSCLF